MSGSMLDTTTSTSDSPNPYFQVGFSDSPVRLADVLPSVSTLLAPKKRATFVNNVKYCLRCQGRKTKFTATSGTPVCRQGFCPFLAVVTTGVWGGNFVRALNWEISLWQVIGEKDGIILEGEKGDFLRVHRGFWFYTIGQRQGCVLQEAHGMLLKKIGSPPCNFKQLRYKEEMEKKCKTTECKSNLT
ncbi:hypothetical protein L2E82_45542 [Cichorium intybus]|uniref:Uncharacterized protein n=1 Tax=Cichorium intybus TaxID=13427 RepID=A0ACB8ZU98_CICIN|nr:hypothetical protein L2E82_45542 [Cichorium intybus]